MIHGEFFQNDVREVLRLFGVQNVQQIKAKLVERDIKIDESQILEALDVLIKRQKARRAENAGFFRI